MNLSADLEASLLRIHFTLHYRRAELKLVEIQGKKIHNIILLKLSSPIKPLCSAQEVKEREREGKEERGRER